MTAESDETAAQHDYALALAAEECRTAAARCDSVRMLLREAAMPSENPSATSMYSDGRTDAERAAQPISICTTNSGLDSHCDYCGRVAYACTDPKCPKIAERLLSPAESPVSESQ